MKLLVALWDYRAGLTIGFAMAPSAECAVLEFEVQNLREELCHGSASRRMSCRFWNYASWKRFDLFLFCFFRTFGMQRVGEELRSYDQQLPCWTAELVAAEAYAEQLEDEAKMAHAEHAEHTRKLTEINPLSPASSEGDRDHAAAVEHYAQMGIDHRHFDDPLIPFAGLSDEEIHKRHVESMMQKEIARREVSIAHLRRQHLYAANESIASSKQDRATSREAAPLRWVYSSVGAKANEGNEKARKRKARSHVASSCY